MRGLRTQEGSDFEKFFKIVQTEAKRLGGVFFSETGEGRDLDLKDMSVCDLAGWLVPFDQADEFEKLYLGEKDKEILDGDNVSVKFDKYDYEKIS